MHLHVLTGSWWKFHEVCKKQQLFAKMSPKAHLYSESLDDKNCCWCFFILQLWVYWARSELTWNKHSELRALMGGLKYLNMRCLWLLGLGNFYITPDNHIASGKCAWMVVKYSLTVINVQSGFVLCIITNMMIIITKHHFSLESASGFISSFYFPNLLGPIAFVILLHKGFNFKAQNVGVGFYFFICSN